MGLIYHYTDINGLHGIIGEGEFWLTDNRFLNDHTEGQYAQNILNKFSDEILRDCNKNYALNIFSQLNQESQANKKGRVYVGSFSEKNILSQWRGYCPKEGGYCIGFDEAQLKDRRGFQIEKCNYDEKKTISQWKKLANDINEQYENGLRIERFLDNEDLQSKRHIFTSDDWEVAYSVLHQAYCSNEIYKIKMTNKHPDYIDERETRIFKFTSPKTISEKNESGHDKFRVRLEDETEVHFRKSNGGLIPYIKLQNIESLIKKVYIGPQGNPDLSLLSLEEFMVHNKKLKFDIEKSDTPLR
ncbi:DUF2971 domain-containing protein [Microbulbifer epialgicus]|uniref:DUF2971 domain-containing protein n=1 Tax=Microbulbifer epialgicus TaxID=393907 RepID=A0ABV4P602_9GAMM